MYLASLAAYGGYIIAGILVILGMFGMQSRQRRGDNDQVASNLIANLKLTVEQQTETMKATNAKLDETTKELHLMQGRNSVLESLFNGSENSILAFLKQAPELLSIAKDNNTLSHQNNAAITSLTGAMERFITAQIPSSATTTTTTIKTA